MASREELSIIRAARSGEAKAQIALGKKYLSGGLGLPKSIPTALYWLDRAAQQDAAEAWRLIGCHVPFEVVLRAGLAPRALRWYERAYDAGDLHAGFELARLVLALPAHSVPPSLRHKALSALALAARADRSGAPSAESMARSIDDAGAAPCEADLERLHRCRQGLRQNGEADPGEVEARLERGALAGDSQDRLALGLWLARIDRDGMRLPSPSGAAQYKRAVRWLLLAAGQGLSEAAYALSKIYLRPEFSQRSVQNARLHLERAALAGHAQAQHEMGISAWRQRRRDPSADIRAAYWLQQAAAKGVAAATRLLQKVAPPSVPAAWALLLLARLPAGAASHHPALLARIELASIFGLSRAEALLIDLHAANCDHCLLVDIRASHGHSRRRLIGVPALQQRHILLRIARRLDEAGDLRADSDIGGDRRNPAAEGQALHGGPGSNYRQRLYRLKQLQARSLAAPVVPVISRFAPA